MLISFRNNGLAVLGLVLGLSGRSLGQVPSIPVAPSTIAASGQGEAKITPDRAAVLVSVQTRASSATVAASDNASRTKQVLDALGRIGLPKEQLTTEGYSVSPEMKYENSAGTSKVTGYVVTNRVRAETKNVNQVGDIVDAALGAGSNVIGGLSFYAASIDDPRRLAIAAAVRNARADADAMARAAGGSLGQLLELSTNGPTIPPRPMYDMAMVRGAVAQATPVNPGEQTVSVYVSARWQFIPR
jgi:uncharacterized protein YggE